jgi:ubiquinone/menaquinone biosynthesis C-methylase UbiE
MIRRGDVLTADVLERCLAFSPRSSWEARAISFDFGFGRRRSAPDRREALEQYRAAASVYDEGSGWANDQRRRVVELLAPGRGDVVLDVGCGTGLCFPLLLERVGPEGGVVGIDQSIDMLAQARHRVDEYGWGDRVRLVLGSVEDADIPVVADGALFCFTHDVLRTPAALDNVVRHLRAGARVAAVGPMWAPWWAPAANLFIWYCTSSYVTTYEGFSEPWSHLARQGDRPLGRYCSSRARKWPIRPLRMNDSALNAAVLAWCFRGQTEDRTPENVPAAVRVALEAARPFIEAPLRAEIERLTRELDEERTRANATREKLLSLLIAQGESVR